MDINTQLEHMIEIARQLGIEVRCIGLGGSGGGLCQLRDKHVLFVDTDADIATQANQCATALAHWPGIDLIFLPPPLRERIDQCKQNNAR